MFDFFPIHGWSTLKKLIWLKAAALSKAVLKTVTGNPIHILDALAKPVQALSVKLEPIQDLHGYDNPWPAGGGKNLLPTQTTVKSGGTYFIGDSTTYFPFKAGTYTASHVGTPAYMYWQKDGTTDNNIIHTQTNSGTFTLTEDCNVRFWFYTNVADASFTDIQIESGSTATSYAPYSNICPISGHTDADVMRTGRNLFDKTSGAKNLYVGLGDKTGTGGTLLCFVAKAGSQYTISMTDGNRTNLYYYESDSLDDIVSGITLNVVTLSAAKPYTFIADHDAVYCYYADTDFQQTVADSCMVELGPTATDYEPYNGNTYTIALGDTVYGGTLDVTQGKLTVDRVMVTLDGSEEWYADGANRYRTRRLDALVKSGRTDVLSSIGIFSNYGTGVGTIFLSPVNDVGNIYYYPPTSITTVNDFKAWLTNNNMEVVYPLATPTTIQLTPTQVELLQGENNIWSDGTMTLVYLADGNASDVEALNILLGGRYVNNHGEDEPTDREALDILLGGNTR